MSSETLEALVLVCGGVLIAASIFACIRIDKVLFPHQGRLIRKSTRRLTTDEQEQILRDVMEAMK